MNIFTHRDTSHKRIVAVGMYDGVHLGHRSLISHLCREADLRGLTPAVATFTSHPLATIAPKQTPPMLTCTDRRLKLLAETGVIDCLLLDFNESLRTLSAREFIIMMHNDYNVTAMLIGYNNRFGHDRIKDFEEYRRIGKEEGVDIIQASQYGKQISSSDIRRFLLNGHPDRALSALGFPYSISGKVVTGNQIGRTIDFPTANIKPCHPEKLIPANGVYATFVTTENGMQHLAVVNIGNRPTITDNSSSPTTIEAYILDYDGNLYGQTITIHFISFLRHEMKFQSIDALRAQISNDTTQARTILNSFKNNTI